jgi:hypothetical protein
MTKQLARDLDSTTSLIGFGLLAEVDDTTAEIDLMPAKRKNRFFASSGVDGYQDE